PEPTPAGGELVEAVVRTLEQAGRLRQDLDGELELDSSELSADEKLGLGSSGAVCTAMVAALVTPGLAAEEVVGLCHRAHRRFQGGVGSGSDVFASFHGGLLEVRGARACPLPLPPALEVAVLWTGRSAST